MADFTIKPASGTGNKLILQAQDGVTDVLTTSDSGVTLDSATLNSPTLVTPALGTPASGVVTNLSGVLPVGVTGGSGLTALSASNLSAGTVPDARFPATLPAINGSALTGNVGKVLNHIVSADGRTTTGNQVGGSWYTGQSVDYTPLSDNSKIYIVCSGGYQEYNNNDSDGNMAFYNRLLIDDTTGSEQMDTHTNFYTNAATHHTKNHFQRHIINNSSTTSINIKFQAYAGGSHRVEYRAHYGMWMQITEVEN